MIWLQDITRFFGIIIVNWHTNIMRRIFVADIFGKTSSLEELSCSVGGQIEIIDPYSGRFIDFTDEAEAYTYFMKNVGIDEYCKILKAKLKSISNKTELIGFSVGASAIWKISDILSPEFTVRAVCFYGSQIRNHLNINPCVEVELVLPEFEPSFNVDELAENLSESANVIIYRTQYLHGFMSYHSINFNHAGYKHYVDWLRTSAS